MKQVLFTTPRSFEESGQDGAVSESGSASDTGEERGEHERREERLGGGGARELRHGVGRPGLCRDQ